MQDHTQRIDIGSGANDGISDLFGCRVAQGHHPPAQLRECSGGICVRLIVDQLGDAKIEQLHLPAFVDEYVGRFQITMHDEVAMRVGDGFQYLAE